MEIARLLFCLLFSRLMLATGERACLLDILESSSFQGCRDKIKAMN